jgi:hypothetical protein
MFEFKVCASCAGRRAVQLSRRRAARPVEPGQRAAAGANGGRQDLRPGAAPRLVRAAPRQRRALCKRRLAPAGGRASTSADSVGSSPSRWWLSSPAWPRSPTSRPRWTRGTPSRCCCAHRAATGCRARARAGRVQGRHQVLVAARHRGQRGQRTVHTLRAADGLRIGQPLYWRTY